MMAGLCQSTAGNREGRLGNDTTWWEGRSGIAGGHSRQRVHLCARSIADAFQFLNAQGLPQVNSDAGQGPSVSGLAPQYRILCDDSHHSSLKIAVSYGWRRAKP